MADVQTYDELIELVSDGYGAGPYVIRNNLDATGASTFASTASMQAKCGGFLTLPSLPSGVTKYRPTFIQYSANSTLGMGVFKFVDLGSLNISTNTFTAGSTMPTRKELGVGSVQTYGSLFVVPTVALNATPGTLNINYTDQDGNSGSVSIAMTASASLLTGSFATLASGDYGVRSVTNTTNRSAGTTPTGTVQFYGLMPIDIGTHMLTNGVGRNLTTGGFHLPELGAGDLIGTLIFTSPTSAGASNTYIWLVGER